MSRSTVQPDFSAPRPPRARRRRVPPSAEWERLLAHLEAGTILVTGGRGHSDLARYLLGQLDRTLSRVALVDAALGRPAVGVPGCLGLALTRPWRAPEALWFVGELDPRSRPLPTVVGTARLVDRARSQGAQAVIVDGGVLQPGPEGRDLQHHLALAAGADQVVTVSSNGDLAGALRGLEAADREMFRVGPPPGDAEVDPAVYRRRRFAAHFHDAQIQRFGLDRLLRRGSGSLEEELPQGRLLGLIREDGTCAALGIVDSLARDHLAVLTPCRRRRDIHHLEPGGVRLDPTEWPEFDGLEDRGAS